MSQSPKRSVEVSINIMIKRSCAPAEDDTETVGSDGMLLDVDVQAATGEFGQHNVADTAKRVEVGRSRRSSHEALATPGFPWG